MDSLSTTPVTSPHSSLFQSSIIFKLPYHLVQRCLHHSANCPGTRPSCWNRHPSIIVRLIYVPPSRHIHPSIIVPLISVLPSRHIHPSIIVRLIICATYLSHSPVHRPVDICAAFPSHSPVHHRPVDLCAAFPCPSSSG